MKKLLFLALLGLLACEKPDEVQALYGCLYGTIKGSTAEVYIRCIHNELHVAGTNQKAADLISDKIGVPRESVEYLKAFSRTRFVQNPKCDCKR